MLPLFRQDLMVATLGSGSRGNATYIGDGKTGVLVDCGLSAKQTHLRLEQLGLSGVPIDAVLLTHEHADHVGGAGVFSRAQAKKHGTPPPFFMTEGTQRGLPERCRPCDPRVIEAGKSFQIGSLRIEPMPVPHDTRDPVCFTVASGNSRIGVITDLGTPTRLLTQQLASLDIAILEFNHDRDMLWDGNYPWPLKQRVAGHHGHLSNRQAAKLLHGALKLSGRLKHVVLAHLSQDNNTPELAHDLASRACRAAGHPKVHITVASQDAPGATLSIQSSAGYDQPEPAVLPATGQQLRLVSPEEKKASSGTE